MSGRLIGARSALLRQSAIRALALCLLTSALPAAQAADGVLVDRIAAIVNTDVITLSEVYDAFSDAISGECPTSLGSDERKDCVARAEGLAVDALIRQRLIRQELTALDLDVTTERVDELIDAAILQHGFPDREALRAEVEASGFTWDGYRAKLMDDERRGLFQGYILRPRVSLAEEEVQDLYQRLAREQEAPEVVRLAAFGYRIPAGATPDETAAIVMKLREELDAVRRGDKLWSDIAEVNDTARVARVFEGQTFADGDLMPQLTKVAFATPPGTPAEPVLVEGIVFGMFVLGREKGTAEVPPFEEVQEGLVQQLMEQKYMEAEDQWYATARRRAAIRFLVGVPPTETGASQP